MELLLTIRSTSPRFVYKFAKVIPRIYEIFTDTNRDIWTLYTSRIRSLWENQTWCEDKISGSYKHYDILFYMINCLICGWLISFEKKDEKCTWLLQGNTLELEVLKSNQIFCFDL